MGNPFCYAELNTNNPKAAKMFYSQLLEWKMQDMDVNGQNYTICHVGDGVPGGIAMGSDGDNRWIAFVDVANLPEKTTLAVKLGGQIKVGPTQIPGFGWFSVVTDPTGAEIGLWRSGDTPA